MQRSRGAGSVGVRCRNDTTVLAGLREEGAAKLRLPRAHGPSREAVMVNTSGGLTDGDRMDWHARIERAARLTLTTQACERIYKAASPEPARVRTRLEVDGTALWLPQETILFDRSRLNRSLDVELGPHARLLACETVLFGRLEMDERDIACSLRDRWDVRREGRLVHAERLSVDGTDLLDRGAIARRARATATVLLMDANGEAALRGVRDVLDGRDAVSGAAWCQATHRLVVRLVAPTGHAMRRTLVPLLEGLAGHLGERLPKVWSL